MTEALILALWRGYMRFLRTDRERVGVAECWVRALLLIVPFLAVALLLCTRAAGLSPKSSYSHEVFGRLRRCLWSGLRHQLRCT